MVEPSDSSQPASTPSVSAAPASASDRGMTPSGNAGSVSVEASGGAGGGGSGGTGPVLGGGAGAREALRVRVTPPRRGDVLGSVLILMAILVLSGPAMMAGLGRPAVSDGEEAVTLTATRSMWERWRGVSSWSELSVEVLEPVFNGRARLEMPPLPLWMNVGAIAMAPPGEVETAQGMVLRARAVSVVMALVTIAGVFWIGKSIGGQATGAVGALLCASNLSLVMGARLASPAIHHVAWVTLSIAAAMWATRPLRPAPSVLRQAVGWATCGVALGAALLSAGPVALLTMAVPALLLMVLCPGRFSHVTGLLAAVILGVLLALPWALYSHDRDPEAWRAWAGTITDVARMDKGALLEQAGSRAGVVLVLLMPWTLWLVGAVVQPFSQSSKGSRTRLFLGWTWFLSLTAVLLALPGGAGQGAMLAVVPAAALLIGQLFNQYADLAAEGRYAKFWRLLRWPHAALVLAATLALPAALHFQRELVERGWLAREWTARVPSSVALAVGVVLLGIFLLSLRGMLGDHPVRTMVTWCLWSMAAMVVTAMPLAQGPLSRDGVLREGEQVGAFASARPVYLLTQTPATRPGEARAELPEADPVLLFYSGRTIVPVTGAQLAEALGDDEVAYLLTPLGAGESRAPAPVGGQPFVSMARLATFQLELWRWAAKSSEGAIRPAPPLMVPAPASAPSPSSSVSSPVISP